MNIQNDTIFAYAEGVKSRTEEFGLLIVSKTTPALSLNMDSKFVWELIDGKRTVSEIVDAVMAEYHNDVVQEGVPHLLDRLLNLGLLIVVSWNN